MHESIRVGTDALTIRVTSEESGGAIAAIEVQMPAGGGPPMLHRHDPFELYRVENGELAFYVEDDDGAVKRSVGKAGTVVSIPGGREHTIRNESEEDARAFVVFSPGAPMERFVRAAGALGEPDVQAVLELASAHGIEMTGPVEGSA